MGFVYYSSYQVPFACFASDNCRSAPNRYQGQKTKCTFMGEKYAFEPSRTDLLIYNKYHDQVMSFKWLWMTPVPTFEASRTVWLSQLSDGQPLQSLHFPLQYDRYPLMINGNSACENRTIACHVFH